VYFPVSFVGSPATYDMPSVTWLRRSPAML